MNSDLFFQKYPESFDQPFSSLFPRGEKKERNWIIDEVDGQPRYKEMYSTLSFFLFCPLYSFVFRSQKSKYRSWCSRATFFFFFCQILCFVSFLFFSFFLTFFRSFISRRNVTEASSKSVTRVPWRFRTARLTRVYAWCKGLLLFNQVYRAYHF